MSKLVDAQAVRDRLLRCVQLLGNAALRAIECSGAVGHEALVDRVHEGLQKAELGIPHAAFFPDDALSRALGFIAVTKANIGGLDASAPELDSHEKLAGRLPRSLPIDPQQLEQQSHIVIRFLQELDYDRLSKYLNFFDAYYDAACATTAEKMRGQGDSKQE